MVVVVVVCTSFLLYLPKPPYFLRFFLFFKFLHAFLPAPHSPFSLLFLSPSLTTLLVSFFPSPAVVHGGKRKGAAEVLLQNVAIREPRNICLTSGIFICLYITV